MLSVPSNTIRIVKLTQWVSKYIAFAENDTVIRITIRSCAWNSLNYEWMLNLANKWNVNMLVTV